MHKVFIKIIIKIDTNTKKVHISFYFISILQISVNQILSIGVVQLHLFICGYMNTYIHVLLTSEFTQMKLTYMFV
jgi:hypothetical protein